MIPKAAATNIAIYAANVVVSPVFTGSFLVVVSVLFVVSVVSVLSVLSVLFVVSVDGFEYP